MDRGYDNNKMFLKLDSMRLDYVSCLIAKRKLLYHNNWTYVKELCNRRKGKEKFLMLYNGNMHLKEYVSQSPVLVGIIKVSLFLQLLF